MSSLTHGLSLGLKFNSHLAGPVVWNSIPAAVCEADTVSSFKRKLKTHFFSMCFDDVWFLLIDFL